MRGLTNPGERDPQIRTPVFIVGKDFVSGVNLRTGIAGSWLHYVHMKDETKSTASSNDIRSHFTQSSIGGSKNKVIPYEQHMRNDVGIISKHEINYAEISHMVGRPKQASRNTCKDHCELIFRKYSDRARAGKLVNAQIPQVGQLSISIGIAAVIFNDALIEAARGKTTIDYKLRHHSAAINRQNNWMTRECEEQNPYKQGKPKNFNDLKSKLDKQFDRDSHVDNMMSEIDQHFQQENLFERQKRDSKLQIMQKMKDRPMSAYGAKDVRSLKSYRSKQSSVRALSRAQGSEAASALSVLPHMEQGQIDQIISDIGYMKSTIVQSAQSLHIGLREVLTSSKLQKVLQKAGYRVNIGQLKVVLKELNFNWNGASCSITQFVDKVKKYNINPQHDQLNALLKAEQFELQKKTDYRGMPEDQDTLHKVIQAKEKNYFDVMRQVFYNLDKSMHEIFSEFSTKPATAQTSGVPPGPETMNRQGKPVLSLPLFTKLMNKYGIVSEQEAKEMFGQIKREFPQAVTFQEFQKAFAVDDPRERVRGPQGTMVAEYQTLVRRVLEWMHKRRYTSKEAFTRLLGSVNRGKQDTLTRYDFQKAVIKENLPLKSPEIDFLFDMLTDINGQKSSMSLDDWESMIKSEARDPLVEIRKIIKQRNLTQDQIMFQLGLKHLDEPLDWVQFKCAIRYIEPTFSDILVQKLFTKLKDVDANNIPVTKFVKNLLGNDQDTVESQRNVLKYLYDEIYRQNRQTEFTELLERADKNNDGELEPMQIGFFIKYITGGMSSPLSDSEIERFVMQLPRQSNQTILYTEFLDLITKVGNKNHNPFKTLVRKIGDFLTSNKISTEELLLRIDPLYGAKEGVTYEQFGKFLKDKVEKTKDLHNLMAYTKLIDVDKDEKICKDDLETCLKNMNSHQFFKNGGQNLQNTQFNADNKFFTIPVKKLNIHKDDPKILEIRKQIAQALHSQNKSYSKIFKDFDSDGDGMLNIGEFQAGIRTILSVNQPTLEKMFSLMDHMKIGMITGDQFYNFLKVEAPTYHLISNNEMPVTLGVEVKEVEDSFAWQNTIIQKIKTWFKSERILQRELDLDPLDAFKSFDFDFDGKVSKEDMKRGIIMFLKEPPSLVTDLRIDRLFKLIGFYKTDTLHPSDFQRLLGDEPHPYAKQEATIKAQENFSKAMGGGFQKSGIHDWKMAAIQQLGTTMSKKYGTIEKSFEEASQGTDKVNFAKFKTFVEKSDFLGGFNMTHELFQKLFGEIDPHKKTYMTFKDWKNTFATFNSSDQLRLEYMQHILTQFYDVSSAFAFYQNFGAEPRTQIDLPLFTSATQSLLPLSKSQIQMIFKEILHDSVFESISLSNFRRFFQQSTFSGKQRLFTKKDAQLMSIGKKGDQRRISKAQLVQSFGESILSRLRLLVQQSGKSLDDIFNQFDTDGSGELTRVEFRKALRAMNLGLTILEINEIITLVDEKDLKGHSRYDKVEGDGKIDYDEFADKLYNMPANEQRMMLRANHRLVQMKENINLYMTSTADAFRMFSKHKKGFLTFKEFEKLVHQLCKYSEEKMARPNFSVLKDMFDVIDIGKDGLIDYKEWSTTFQHMGVAEQGTVNMPQPQTFGEKNALKQTSVTSWEHGPEHARIGACIAKNRNALLKKFKENSTHSSYDGQPKYVTFAQAKKAMDQLLHENFTNCRDPIYINDDRLALLLSVGQLEQKLTSSKPKEIPSFGHGYYEEKQKKEHPYAAKMYDFTKLLDVYRQRYDHKVSVF